MNKLWTPRMLQRVAEWMTTDDRRASLAAWLVRCVGWLALIWTVVFWRLGYLSLLDPDEAHYAQLTREMLRARSWFVPLLDGRAFIDKPVLFHWTQAASMAVFGDSEFAIRLPTAIAAVAAILLTRWAGKTLFGPRAGTWGAAMFATLPATFALSSVALFDMVFTVFLFAGIAGLIAAMVREVPWYVEASTFACLGLAVLTKGPVALLLVAGWAAVLAFDTRSRLRLLNVHWLAGLSLVVVIAAPWFVWMYFQFRDRFVSEYLLAGNLFYLTQPATFSQRSVQHTYYARVFAGAFFPWSVVVLARAWQMVRKASIEAEPIEELCLWAWIVVVVGFFSVARFKLDHYIFPAAPAVALIAAKTWLNAGSVSDSKPAVAAVALIAGALIVGGVALAPVIYRIDLPVDAVALALPIVVALTGVLLAWQSIRAGMSVPATPLTLIAGMVAAYGVIVAIGLPVLENTRPMAHIARRIARNAPTAPVAVYGLDRWRASLRYYVNRPVTSLETTQQVRDFVARDPSARIVMRRRDFEALKAQGMSVDTIYERRGVTETAGRGLRRQVWSRIVIVTSAETAMRASADADPR